MLFRSLLSAIGFYFVTKEMVVPTKEFSQALGIKEDDLDAMMKSFKAKLLEKRQARPKPFKDDKIISSWNGLMIDVLARAGLCFSEKKYKIIFFNFGEKIFESVHINSIFKYIVICFETISDVHPGIEYPFLHKEYESGSPVVLTYKLTPSASSYSILEDNMLIAGNTVKESYIKD